MNKIVLLLSLFSLAVVCRAQEPSAGNFKHQLGVNFGGVTGLGPSYRYWPGKFGIQLTFLPVKISEDWQDPLHVKDFYQAFFPFNGTQKFISAGLGGLLTVKELTKSRLVVYLSNHLLINDEKEVYNLGGGFGIAFDTRVGFSLLLGYAGYDITGIPATFPTAEVGIHVGLSKK